VFSPYKGEEAKERAAKRMELNAQRRQQLEQERKLLLKAMEIVAPPVPAAIAAIAKAPVALHNHGGHLADSDEDSDSS